MFYVLLMLKYSLLDLLLGINQSKYYEENLATKQEKATNHPRIQKY